MMYCTSQLFRKRNIFKVLKRKFVDEINKGKGRFSNEVIQFHEPGKNYINENYISTENTLKLIEDHLKRTGGKVRTRFAPEPNGLLHIGHAKAINLNFNYAKDNGGICFLRYDDTNPTKEEDLYVQGIREMVEWLGFQPFKITYASDYFPHLYKMAKNLIKKDLAYVCHQPIGTDNSISSPWRDRNISESLQAFGDMKNRKYEEGEATLRLKMTTLQKTVDPVAYRIKHASHHRTKDEWCIYPTYDFAHCLCDSLEDITHSFCSFEFAHRRPTYYWVCNSSDLYCPVQIEYGRLNFHYTVLSKRKIASLIKAGIVEGWDDPRLYSLEALRRRGFPPESINEFCSQFGFQPVSSFINPVHLNYYVRKTLEDTATRIMAVFNPLKLVIINYPYSEEKEFKVSNVRHDKSKGFHSVTFDKEIFIEQSDFQEVGEKDFRRLTRNQHVGLKYTSHVIKLKEIIYKSCGKEIDHLQVEYIPLKESKKPRAYIHWISKPIVAEARIYENLFKSERPDDERTVPNGFLSDVNPNSLSISNVFIGRSSINNFSPLQRFQFERNAYFCVDLDSKKDKLVFNKIVDLKQEKGF